LRWVMTSQYQRPLPLGMTRNSTSGCAVSMISLPLSVSRAPQEDYRLRRTQHKERR
jgi:hypothetical protein